MGLTCDPYELQSIIQTEAILWFLVFMFAIGLVIVNHNSDGPKPPEDRNRKYPDWHW